MEHEHLVAPMPQEAERLEREGAVEQQVGHEDHQPPTAELADDPPERGLRRGALAGPELGQGLQQLAPVAEPGARRR